MKMSKKHKLEGEFKKEGEAPKRKRRNIFADYATGKADPTQVKPLVPVDHDQTDSQQTTIGPEVPTDNVEINSNYSKVANALLENRERMSTLEYAVFLHLFRLSWGYGRNHLRVALDKLKDTCVVSRDSVQRALSALEKRGLIIRHERNYKKGNWYVVRLPASCSSACRLSASRLSASGKPTIGKQLTDYQQAFIEKDNLKNNFKNTSPLSPSEKGELQLKIETARWRKDGPWWEPWDQISAKLRQTLPQEDFQPLSRVLGAVRGLGKSIHIRADGLTPEVLSEPLKKALAEALTEQGITVLRIAV